MAAPHDSPPPSPHDPTLDTTIVSREGGAPLPPPPGPTTKVGHYLLEKELGRGGMGIVYRALDTALGRPVALKMILDGRRGGPGALARFRREATATAKLRHPGIVTVFDVGEHEGRPFVVLELIEGQDLAELIAKQPLEPRRAAAIARGIARALAHAHESGIIHRDVKPGNVLLEKGDEPKLMDFGLAHVAGDATELTRTGEILGTPAYMAPEQARGREPGPAADVYGVGAVLYHALTGSAPFQASNVHALIVQVIEKEPAPIRKLRPEVPPDLETIVARCLAKEPTSRYATATALADDLDRYLASQPIRARPVGRVERLAAWVRRDRRLAGAIALLLVAATFATVFAARLQLREREEAQKRRDLADAQRARRETVRALVESVRSSDTETRAAALQETIDRLASLRDAETVSLLADELDRASLTLVSAAQAVYLQAQPIAGLESAVRVLANANTPPHESDVRILREAESRCEERANGAALGPRQKMGTLVAAEQARRLGRGDALVVRVACEALGRIGVRARAEEALERYLVLERDELRASFAGEALARLGGEAAEATIRRIAWHRFGDIDGIFWQRVSPILLEHVRPLPPDAASIVSRSIEEAQVLEERGDSKAALAAIERGLAAVHGHGAELWNQLGVVRSHAGDLEGAFDAISRALELKPRASKFRANRAWVRQQRGDLEGALADAAKAIELDPTFEGGWLNSAVAHRALGDREAAWAELARALELEPNEPIALLNRGALRADRGDLDGALADLDRAVELKPRLAAALEQRSQLHRRRGEPGAAIVDASRATEVAPRNPSAWTELASARLSHGEPAAAATAASRAIELDPRNANAYSLRGGARASQGDIEGGLADMSSAIAIDSRCVAAIANRGSLRASRGDLAGAIADFTRAIDIDDRVPERWFNRGHARYQKGDLDAAIADLGHAIDLRPGFAQAWGVRGLARKKKGDKAGARADLTKALELGPRLPGAKSARAALAELEKEAEKDGKGGDADDD